MNPEISVVLPYYEGDLTALGRAVESVLAQEGAASELLVVNDGSRRSPARALAPGDGARVRLIEKGHGGVGAALNRGAREARGALLCFLDQDDVMMPGRLALQAGALAREGAVDAVYSDYERVTAGGRLIDRVAHRQESAAELLRLLARAESPVTLQTLMIRRAAFLGVGGFSEDPALSGHADAEFLARLLVSGAAVRHVPGIVQQWVRHGGNYSESLRSMEARPVLLRHLSGLAERFPAIGRELPRFRCHAHARRGLFYLEHGRAGQAVPEFLKALSAGPLEGTIYYWLLKALCRSIPRRTPGWKKREGMGGSP